MIHYYYRFNFKIRLTNGSSFAETEEATINGQKRMQKKKKNES